VSNFIVQAIRGEPLSVYGEGSQTRSFCYQSDEVDGIYRLFMSDYPMPVNIGNPDEFTVIELANKVIELTDSASGIEHQPLPKDDPKVRRPDITVARRELGWEPRIALEEGLRKTIPYFRDKVMTTNAGARSLFEPGNETET
jgi:dTDP-glucose 4,6-dehydratase